MTNPSLITPLVAAELNQSQARHQRTNRRLRGAKLRLRRRSAAPRHLVAGRRTAVPPFA